jgi:hypothetical protein
MSDIYIVLGQTGDIHKGVSWAVKAFKDRSKAEDLAIKATVRAKQIYENSKKQGIEKFNSRYFDSQNEFDSSMRMYYNGTIYFVDVLSLGD